MRWKNFLHYNAGTRIAVILLLILIVLVFILNAFLSYRHSSEIVMVQNDSIVREFNEFIDSLKIKGVNTEEKSNAQALQEKTLSVPIEEYSSFKDEKDKNSISENVYPVYQKVDKLLAGETISLNETDTSEWKKIPGIGSSFSSRIVKYRALLGGYVSKEQLLEVYGIDNELYAKINTYIVEDDDFMRLSVNKLEFRELLRHPYLNYKQVQAIVNLRQKKGDITSINELGMLDEFTSEDIHRLRPYLNF